VERVRDARVLFRHVRALHQTGQLRFRAETFGLYYPALPYRRPWWRLSPLEAVRFARRATDYAYWVVEMHHLKQEGDAGWWLRRGGSPVGWADPSTDTVRRDV
jgi:hypothetical protein